MFVDVLMLVIGIALLTGGGQLRGLDCGLRRNDGRAAGADVGNHKV